MSFPLESLLQRHSRSVLIPQLGSKYDKLYDTLQSRYGGS